MSWFWIDAVPDACVTSRLNWIQQNARPLLVHMPCNQILASPNDLTRTGQSSESSVQPNLGKLIPIYIYVYITYYTCVCVCVFALLASFLVSQVGMFVVFADKTGWSSFKCLTCCDLPGKGCHKHNIPCCCLQKIGEQWHLNFKWQTDGRTMAPRISHGRKC